MFLKPENVTAVEAASIPYAGLTAWSSLWITGGICYKTLLRNTRMNKPVLVLGGSGGVGTLAIQLLKAWNFKVQIHIFNLKLQFSKLRYNIFD